MADNTLHITIDPSGAMRGANQTINALNSIVNASNSLNMQINVTNVQLGKLGSAADRASGFFDKLRKGWLLFKASMLLTIPLTMLDSLIDKMISVDRSYQSFMSSMFVSTGSMKKSADAFEFVSKVARAYGVELETVSKSYAKFRAAVTGSLPTAAADKLFLSISAVSSVLHLAPQSVDRIFTAFTQMASKGQVMSEELKQQLGEHLPGAVALAAQAMGVSVKELIKMMKEGSVDINKFFLNMPDVIMKKFGEAAKISSQSIIAQINNLKSTIFKNMIEFNNSGASVGLSKFIQSIDNLLQPTTEHFKVFGSVVGQAFLNASKFIESLTPKQVEEFAKQLVEAVSALIQLVKWFTAAAVFIVKHNELILNLAIGYGALKVAMWGVSTASAGTVVSAGLATKSLGLLGRTVALVAAAFIGWEIGKVLTEKFQIIDTFGIELTRKLYIVTDGFFRAISLTFSVGGMYIRKFAETSIGALVKLRNFVGQFVPGMDINVEEPTFGGDESAKNVEAQIKEWKSSAEKNNKYFDQLRTDSNNKHNPKLNTSEIDDATKKYKTQLQLLTELQAEQERLKAEAASEMAKMPKDNSAAEKAAKKAASELAKDIRQRIGLMNEVLESYKTEYTAKVTEIQNMVKAEDISPAQGFKKEAEALKQYSSDVLSELYKYQAIKGLSAKQREDINNKILAAETYYMNEAKRLRTEAKKDFEEYMFSILDFEESTGVKRLTNLDKFAIEWDKKNKKLLARARLEGDQNTIDRIQRARDYGTAKNSYTANDSVGYTSDNAAYDLMKDKNKLFALDTKMTLASVRGEYDEYFKDVGVLTKQGTLDTAQATKTHNELMISRSKAVQDAAVTVAKARLDLGIDSNFNSMIVLLDQLSGGFTNLQSEATKAFIEIGKSLSDNIASNLTSVITGAKSLQEAFSDIAATVMNEVISAIIKIGIQMAANAAMNSVMGKAAAAESAATAATTGATITASMAPAAATTSLATMGSNTITASTGMLAFGAVMAAMLGALLAGAFDNGGYIPDGKLGIVGEYGPEIVSGPVAVTGRKNTESILRSAASGNGETSGGDHVEFNVDIQISVSDSGTNVSGANTELLKQMGNQMAEIAKKVLYTEYKQGGLIDGKR